MAKAKVSVLPDTPEERRSMLDDMSAHHDTLDDAQLVVFSDLATQVAVDDEEALVTKTEEDVNNRVINSEELS